MDLIKSVNMIILIRWPNHKSKISRIEHTRDVYKVKTVCVLEKYVVYRLTNPNNYNDLLQITSIWWLNNKFNENKNTKVVLYMYTHDRHTTLGRCILASIHLCYCTCANNQFLFTCTLSLLYCRVVIIAIKHNVFPYKYPDIIRLD